MCPSANNLFNCVWGQIVSVEIHLFVRDVANFFHTCQKRHFGKRKFHSCLNTHNAIESFQIFVKCPILLKLFCKCSYESDFFQLGKCDIVARQHCDNLWQHYDNSRQHCNNLRQLRQFTTICDNCPAELEQFCHRCKKRQLVSQKLKVCIKDILAQWQTVWWATFTSQPLFKRNWWTELISNGSF